MKSAFHVTDDENYELDETFEFPDDEDDSHDDTNETIDLSYWSPQPLIHFDGWMDWMCSTSTSTCCA